MLSQMCSNRNNLKNSYAQPLCTYPSSCNSLQDVGPAFLSLFRDGGSGLRFLIGFECGPDFNVAPTSLGAEGRQGEIGALLSSG